MNEKNFIEQLINFDKKNIPDNVINKIKRDFLSNDEFNPQRVVKASFACKGLVQWIIKME